MVHDLSMLVLTVLLVGHLYFTFVYKALSAMTTGYVPKEDAQIEHAKWVEEMEHPAHPRPVPQAPLTRPASLSQRGSLPSVGHRAPHSSARLKMQMPPSKPQSRSNE